MTDHPRLTLRPIEPMDREPLYELHRAAMFAYVHEVWGWEESTQREFWKHTAHDGVQVIEREGELAGYLDLRWHPDHADIVNIVLAPTFQGRGIGKAIITGIVAEARQRNMDVRLQVLKVNPRAHALYRRLGFEDIGETGTHIQMTRTCPGKER